MKTFLGFTTGLLAGILVGFTGCAVLWAVVDDDEKKVNKVVTNNVTEFHTK